MPEWSKAEREAADKEITAGANAAVRRDRLRGVGPAAAPVEVQRRTTMQIPVEALIAILDRVLVGAFALAGLVAQLRAGQEVTDAEARPTPRADIEARVEKFRDAMILEEKRARGGEVGTSMDVSG